MTHCHSKYYMKLHVNGQQQITNKDIGNIYRQAVKDDLMGIVMIGEHITEEGFRVFVKDATNCFMFIYQHDHTPVAFCWLNNFSGRTAHIHFCVLRHAFSQSFDIGQFVCHWLLGTNYVDVLIGVTPRPYRAALNYVKKLGFKEIARIPKVFEIRGRLFDGVLTTKTKEV